MKKLLFVACLFLGCISYKTAFSQEDSVCIYRWYVPHYKQYVTVADGEYADGLLAMRGWTDKTPLFYGYRKPAPQLKPVYGWVNPVSNITVSVYDGEYTDKQMMAHGYAQKHIQCYALPNKRLHLKTN